MNIWQSCKGEQHKSTFSGTLYRLVESQEQVATMGYVDTLDEQALLEEMLDGIKPPYPENTQPYHYLLKTPFRYPPLKWGSRFGRVHEPSLFYGGLSVEATLAESAFYRFVFWGSMEGTPPKDKLRSEHTVFSVGYTAEKGIQLQAPPFNAFEATLRDPLNYSDTQALGSAMRNAEVDAFEYVSARDQSKGLCIALFNASVFKQKKPKSMNQWLCELSANEVLFKQLADDRVYRFNLEAFLVDGELPFPAA